MQYVENSDQLKRLFIGGLQAVAVARLGVTSCFPHRLPLGLLRAAGSSCFLVSSQLKRS